MKTKTIYLIFLVLFVVGGTLTIANDVLPDHIFAKEGTILINDDNTTKNVTYEASGNCYKVVDGDTIWVEGVGKIRLVGINTPEKNEEGFNEARNFVVENCLDKTVYLDIDNERNKDKYNRTLAIVYSEDMNINKVLLEKKLAEIMYIPPSEFPKGLGT